jgi:hypothetical protein
MQITSNTTRMPAELCVAVGVDAREYCVVAVKGTFMTDSSGQLTLAEQQESLVTADQHHGDPATTSVRYECDFAFEKPLTDVIVVGKAVAPRNQPVERLAVRLEVEGVRKDLWVHGERQWVDVLGSLHVSDAIPFIEMPITFERAWGGVDDSRGPNAAAAELRNLVGIGFAPHRDGADLDGRPLPNIECIDQPVASPRGNYDVGGFGCVGRSWQPRRRFAGTFDEAWLDARAPFLPADFDSRYHQCAPLDQQFAPFKGGETIRCFNMATETVSYRAPVLTVPVCFRFQNADVDRNATLDTVVLEPHLRRALLTWRARVALPRKASDLREILVGERARRHTRARSEGKSVFSGLGEAVAWLGENRRRG